MNSLFAKTHPGTLKIDRSQSDLRLYRKLLVPRLTIRDKPTVVFTTNVRLVFNHENAFLAKRPNKNDALFQCNDVADPTWITRSIIGTIPLAVLVVTLVLTLALPVNMTLTKASFG